MISAGAFIWLYNRTFEQRDWTKRGEIQEKFRRRWSFALWGCGLITCFIPIISCYEPEPIYEALHCQLPVLIDALATFECLCVSYFLLTCSGTNYYDWIGLVVGFLGCTFSLLSSIGGLGSITNSLVLISNWYFGAIGFFVATVPRSYTRIFLKKFWGWANAHVEAEQREEIPL